MLGFFCAALTVLFIGLKIAGVIAWGWLAVLAPMIVYCVLVVALFLIGLFAG